MSQQEVQPKKPGKTEYNVTPAQFVEAWQTSDSVQEVARKLGMPTGIVNARVSSYRKAGIRLKKMPRRSSGPTLDVQAMNDLVDQLDRKMGRTPDPEPPPRSDPVLTVTPQAVETVVAQIVDKITKKTGRTS